uniref:Transmembrane protein n=1 Tax=Haemonchus contortus TaxID=6289 RepID=A0A7I4Z5L7_HAECO
MLVLQGAILTICVTGICGISLLEAYHSDAQTARRRGMLNVRFRPVMHLRGTDDWRKQVGMETLHNQMMDENGIVFDLRPPTNDKVSSIFSAPTNTHG